VGIIGLKEPSILPDVFTTAMHNSPRDRGFASRSAQSRRGPTLVATAGLALAIVVMAIAVASGAARADVLEGVVGNEGGVFAIALILGLAFIGMGSLTPLGGRRAKRR
jgi:uncharacterized membrane protein